MTAGARRRASETGAAAVEFAIVVSLFLTIVMGMIDYGWFFFCEHIVTNAAREGARAGTLWTKQVDTTGDKAIDDATKTTTQYLANSSAFVAAKCPAPVVKLHDVAAGSLPGYQTVRVELACPVGSITGLLPASLIPAVAKGQAEMRRP
jgi:hypothetical protein